MNILPIAFGTPEYDESVQLRYRILRKPLALFFNEEQLATEYNDIHLAYFNQQEQIIGCLVLTPLDEKTLKMRQVAVDELAQKQGIGTALVNYSEAWAIRNGFTKISLHARDIAIPFYKNLGYETYGEPFTEVGIPHLAMQKSLK